MINCAALCRRSRAASACLRDHDGQRTLVRDGPGPGRLARCSSLRGADDARIGEELGSGKDGGEVDVGGGNLVEFGLALEFREQPGIPAIGRDGQIDRRALDLLLPISILCAEPNRGSWRAVFGSLGSGRRE